jgi:hypothetical protein
MQLFVHKMADSECDADDLFLMPIIIPQLDLQAEFPDLDSENSEGEETALLYPNIERIFIFSKLKMREKL